MQLTKGVYKLVDQPHFLGFVRSDISSCQHHVKGAGQAHLKVSSGDVSIVVILHCHVLQQASWNQSLTDIWVIWNIPLLTILGSLWVPPAPGRRPSITSGVPRTVFLLFVATLYWQAMAN